MNFLAGIVAGQQAHSNRLAIEQQEQQGRAQNIQRLAMSIKRSPDKVRAWSSGLSALTAMGVDTSGLPQAWDQTAEAMTNFYAMPERERTALESNFELYRQQLGDDGAREWLLTNGGLLPDANAQLRAAQPDAPPTSVREFEYSRNNPEFAEWRTNQRRASAPQVNLGADQNAFEEQLGKDLAKQYNTMLEGASSAQSQLNNLAEIESVIQNGDATMGFGAEAILTGKRALQALGMDVAGVADGEALVAMSSQATLDAVGQLSGVASDTDMRVVMEGVNRLSDTREGALAKIGIARRAAEYRIAVTNAASQYIAENGQLDAGWMSRKNEMSDAFRSEVLGQIRQSEAFEGYNYEGKMEVFGRLRQQYPNDPQKVLEIMRRDGLL